jgi:tetratricopeptide (TPR) repeat protein
MSPALLRLAAVACAATLALAPAAATASLTVEWYLLRGRHSARIGNWKAAAEAYEKAVQLDPGNREASRALALAWERNGETDRAIAQLDRHLARWDDEPDLAFKQARWLGWSRYAYRRPDAIRYYRMGLAHRDDPAMRHDLARLLAADRATLDEALSEYRTLLAAPSASAAWRAEYRKLLLWDDRHRDEAVRELERAVSEDPGDAASARALARLLAKDPRRLAEAEARYRALLERSPGDAALRLERARVLARLPGRRDEAAGEYRRVLVGRPSREARMEYAELLAADPATRPQAVPELKALAAAAADSKARIGYARLLGERRETSGAAATQYQAVLARDPANAEAHEGLARAYAWEGESDRALDHASRALERDPRRSGAAELRDALRAGREPALGGGARALAQGGGSLALSGGAAFAAFEADASPYVRTWVEAGAEAYGDAGRDLSGALAVVRTQVRPSREGRLDASLAWRGARPGADAALGAVAWSSGGADVSWSLRAERRAREDSPLAFGGRRADGGEAAPATEHVAALVLAWRAGPFRAEAGPEAGFVADASGTNPVIGGRAALALPWSSGRWTVSPRLELAVVHYGEDRSWTGAGAAPGTTLGGYFSPTLLATASPRLAVAYQRFPAVRLALEGGPALQWLDDAHGARAQLGGDLRAEASRRLGRLRLGATFGFVRVADAYTRVEGGASLALLF